MGYRSTGTFTARGLNGKPIMGLKRKRLEAALEDDLWLNIESGENENSIDGYFDEMKFYADYQQQIIDCSKRFKNVFFHFKIDGEEAGDMWDFFAVNGKWQKREAEVKRFDKPKKGEWYRSKIPGAI